MWLIIRVMMVANASITRSTRNPAKIKMVISQAKQLRYKTIWKWNERYRATKLTILKTAPRRTAFKRESKSNGNFAPNVSVRVKYSFMDPLWSLAICPIQVVLSGRKMLNGTSPSMAQLQQLRPPSGPKMIKTISPAEFLTWKVARNTSTCNN